MEGMERMSEDTMELEELMKDACETYCQPILFTLKFHLLYYAGKDVEKYGVLNILSALLFE